MSYNFSAAFPNSPEDGQTVQWSEELKRWIAVDPPSGGGSVLSSALTELATVSVVGAGPAFQAISATELILALQPGFDIVTALLVVNSNNNDGFAIGLRITYTEDEGATWFELPGSSFVDVNSISIRNHLSVMGTVDNPNITHIRAEWTAYGDSGTWDLPGTDAGSATLTAWQS